LVIQRLPSNAKAKHCSTWSWRQVNRPLLRVGLHPVRMCLNVAGDEHKGQEGSSPTQRFRFCGDGRTSYVDLIRKLILLSSIDQRSCQPNFRCSTLSHLIHSPCLDWELAFIHLILSSCFRTLLTTSFLLWAGPALCHLGGAKLEPKTPSPAVPVPRYPQFERQPLPLLQISLLTTFYQFLTQGLPPLHICRVTLLM